MSAPWVSDTAEGALLRLRVAPRAKRTVVQGPHGDALKIRLAAPPVDGKANEALIAFLAERLDTPRQGIQLAHGAGGRDKQIAVTGLSAQAVYDRLMPS